MTTTSSGILNSFYAFNFEAFKIELAVLWDKRLQKKSMDKFVENSSEFQSSMEIYSDSSACGKLNWPSPFNGTLHLACKQSILNLETFWDGQYRDK